ncbi:N-acetylneuraminate synthase [Pontibacterium granulatum]|uniref:N-acetylneuraminate synthase n=1 Tax=Pontibacterium granulatum TaxID=2036029 RepID=UPI00249AA257|nr:N-acetylneuraminate synthase [Pontibacterium granulatum]MDI3323042.1 N-acetylneuraminate synthase [Pontibacterium granulatum]
MSVYVIAEAGVNHNGSMELALELIRVAKACGADAVKFQTFKTDKLVTSKAKKALYQDKNDAESSTQAEMLRRLELSDSQFIELASECNKQGIDFLTTCFDRESLTVICEGADPKLLKIGSGDLTNLPLIIDHARTGRDIIISTGMATMSEVEDALAALAYGYLTDTGQPQSYSWLKRRYFTEDALEKVRNKITVLHCVTDYPAQPADLNLNAIRQLHDVYKVNTGYSDHSLGMEACCAAVALGATCIEKHITLDPSLPGPDHKASASPQQFKALVDAIRNLEQALKPKIKAPTTAEIANLEVARKYLVAAKPIAKGEVFSIEDIEIKRSKVGQMPGKLWDLLGQVADKDYEAGDSI